MRIFSIRLREVRKEKKHRDDDDEDKKLKTGNEMIGRGKEKEFEKVKDPDVSIMERHEILSKPQVGQGIFTLLESTILPALISLFTNS